MKNIGKRTEVFYTIELSQNQIITLITALGITTPEERRSEAVVFFQLDDFKDDGNLFDSLAELVDLSEKQGKPAISPLSYPSSF